MAEVQMRSLGAGCGQTRILAFVNCGIALPEMAGRHACVPYALEEETPHVVF